MAGRGKGTARHAKRVRGAGRAAAWLREGLEGSRSRDTTIQAYYGRVEKGSQQTPNVDVSDPSIGDRVNVRAYGEKVAKSVVGQLRENGRS